MKKRSNKTIAVIALVTSLWTTLSFAAEISCQGVIKISSSDLLVLHNLRTWEGKHYVECEYNEYINNERVGNSFVRKTPGHLSPEIVTKYRWQQEANEFTCMVWPANQRLDETRVEEAAKQCSFLP